MASDPQFSERPAYLIIFPGRHSNYHIFPISILIPHLCAGSLFSGCCKNLTLSGRGAAKGGQTAIRRQRVRNNINPEFVCIGMPKPVRTGEKQTHSGVSMQLSHQAHLTQTPVKWIDIRRMLL